MMTLLLMLLILWMKWLLFETVNVSHLKQITNMCTNFQTRVDCLWNLSKTDASIVSFFLTSTKLKSSFSACRCTLLWGDSIVLYPHVGLKEFQLIL